MDAAALAEKLGATTVRQWASLELRKLGRRLAPIAGAGWDALSKREQQITLLAAEGYSNRSIATALYLSERTVQSHLSRTLVALGVSSRAAIPGSLWPTTPPDFALFELTRRQQEVAMLVIDGHPNRTIASTLDISEKTVEKHIQGMFEKLGVSSRTGIANRLLASGEGARA
jgi:DNA-binding NarL/FixJ family response regulator